jgi:hypothetical protein
LKKISYLLQIEEKLSHADLMAARALETKRSRGRSQGPWLRGALNVVFSRDGDNGGSRNLRASVAGLKMMEATLAADVAELRAEHEREKVRFTRSDKLGRS